MTGGIHNDNLIYPELSYTIVGILFEVYNRLGHGYQERYYERAIKNELTKQGIFFKNQHPFKLMYKGECIGRYFLDFLIEDKLILEIKTGDYFARRNFEQVKAYLHGTKRQLAILANFTSKGVKYKRVVNIVD